MTIETENKNPYQPTKREIKAAERMLDDDHDQEMGSREREELLNAELSELDPSFNDIYIDESNGKIYEILKETFPSPDSTISKDLPSGPHERTPKEALDTLEYYEREVREEIDRAEAMIKNIQTLKQRIVELKEKQEKK
jgi:hypothetical protein